MSKADDTFVKQFGIVLVLLFVFTVAMVWLANGIGGPAMDKARNSPSVVAERVARVGSVRYEGDPMPAGAPAAVAAPAAAPAGGTRGGEEVYNLACIACHASGAAGAPMLGDEAAWADRLGQGLDALVNSAINGKNAMPARGGMAQLSDEEVRNAVTWILDQTGIELSAAPAPAATQAAAAPAAAEPATAAAAAPAAAEPAAQAAAADGKPGEEVYNTSCLACHLTGAANAPRVGDNGQWAKRLATGGLDALVHNAVNGKGVMPAKGGNPGLEDADIRNAVVFMLEESDVAL